MRIKAFVSVVVLVCLIVFCGCNANDDEMDAGTDDYVEDIATVTLDDGTEVEVGTVFLLDDNEQIESQTTISEIWDEFYRNEYSAVEKYNGAVRGYGVVANIKTKQQKDMLIYTEDGVVVDIYYIDEDSSDYYSRICPGDIIEYEGEMKTDYINTGGYESEDYIGYINVRSGWATGVWHMNE